MLGKNNYNERLKRMEMQAKRDRFSIRKLSIGAASVFLGFTFFGLNSQAVKANSVIPEQNATEEANQQATDNNQSNATPPSQAATASATKNQDSATSNAPTATKTNSNPLSEKTDDRQAKLSTYTGLSTFLKDTDKATAPTAPAQNTKADSHKVDNSNNAQAEVNPNGTSASINTDNSKQAITAGNNAQGTTNPTGSINAPAGSTTNNGAPQADANGNPDLTGTANNDQQAKLPADSVADANQASNSTKVPSPAKPLTPADQDKDMTPKVGVQDTNSGKTEVHNWKEFKNAISGDYSEIDIMNDISYDEALSINFPTLKSRKVVIKSGGDGTKKYTLHLGDASPYATNDNLDLTYSNLNIIVNNYYGAVDTDLIGLNHRAKITFDNITFTGSQFSHAVNNTDIYLTGNNIAETVPTPISGSNGTANCFNYQQLFEFMGDNNSINFVNGKFTGTTIGGTTIQMSGKGNKVNIAQGAEVTLNPAGNAYLGIVDPGGAEGTAQIYGIWMGPSGTGNQVNVDGKLNINIGQDNRNAKTSASAIYIGNKDSSFNINTNGSVEVKTNGNINNSQATENLIYDGGNFNIAPKGSLKITGTNMGNYSGTLFLISGSAQVNNGTFEMALTGDSSGQGAGTGAITLVDVQGGALTVNNPQSLILNANSNHNSRTAIVGTTPITLNNVSQILNINGSDIVLPPFLELGLKIDSITSTGMNLKVPSLVLLNGKRKLTKETINNLQDPYKELLASLITGGVVKEDMTYDDIFKNIIIAAFGDRTLLPTGYNNVRFKSANPDGFLDLERVNVAVNDDGSRTVTGHIVNYTEEKDGPGSDGIFSRILPGGTHAYISAKIGTTDIDNVESKSKPYPDTNIGSRPMPNKFAAQADENGNFSFTIPADQVNKLAPKTRIELTPHANFIGYDPNNKNDHTYDLLIKDISNVRTDAATAINAAIRAAKNQVGNNSNLTGQAKTDFDAAMDKYGQDAISPIPAGHEGTSVYDPSAKDEKTINNHRDRAVKGVNDALTNAMKAIAKQEVANAAQAAKDAFPKDAFPAEKDKIDAAIDAAFNDESAIDNVLGVDANNKVDVVQGNINNAKNNLINAVNNAAKTYTKTQINNNIQATNNQIDQIAEDPNISQAAKDAITKLKDRTELSDAAAIAKEGGTIDQDTSVDAVKGHYVDANGKIKNITDIIDAIKKVEQAAQDQITQHPEDKGDIQGSLDDIINNIINGTDKDGSKGTDTINGIVLNQNRTQAANEIDKAAAAAIEQINKLGLSDADKQNYIDAINAAKNLATAKPDDSKFDKNKSIYGQNTQTDIDQIVTATKNTFNKEVAKADLANTAKSYLDSIGLTADDSISSILTSWQKVIDNSTQIEADKNTAENRLFATLQKVAKEHLTAYESEIENNIRQLGLSANDEATALAQARAVIAKGSEYIAAIDSAKNKEDVGKAYYAARGALGGILAQATTTAAKSDAIRQIQDKQKEIRDSINNQKYPSLSSDDIAKLQKDVDDAAQAGIAKITNERDNNQITTDLNEALNNIAGVAADAASLNDLIGQRKDAIAKLQQKAQAAKAQIDAKPDTELSATDKANYKNLIDQHEKAGEISINAADKDNVDNAENLAEQQIDKDLAAVELDAAKSRASKAVNDQYQTDLAKIKDSSLDGTTQTEYINQLNKIRDNGLSQINGAQSLETVNQNKAVTINGMDQLVAGIKNKELEQARDKARGDLDAAAQAVRQHIKQDPNLSDNEKDKYYQDINATVAEANQAITSATDKSAVDTAVRVGQDKLTQIQAQADLQSSKEAAQHDLLAEQSKVINQIKDLKHVNSDRKTELINQVKEIYNRAKQEIDAQATIQQVVGSRDQGIADMDKVVTGAREVNETINADLDKLDAAAEKAIAEINNSTLSKDDKDKAQKNIESARDYAKEQVKNSITSETANKAEAAGETEINRIKNDALKQDLDAAKTAGKGKVDQAAADAIQRIKDQFDKLTEAEKTQVADARDKALETINDAKTAADQAIDQATSKTDINNLVTDATNKINQAESDFNLDIIKLQANNAIDQHAKDAKEGLDSSNQDTIDAINNIVNEAENSINKNTDANTIRLIKEGAISAIDNIKQHQELKDAKNKAIAELDKALNGDAQAKPPVIGIKNKIEALPGLSLEQKKQFKQQAQDAHDRAVNNINGSASQAEIDANKVTGLADIGQALTDAILQNAKEKASEDLDHYATEAKGSYADSTNLDDKQKQDLNKRIEDAVNKAKADLGSTTTDTTAKVDSIVSAAKGVIDGIKTEAQVNGLTQGKQNVKSNLEDEAEKLRQRVKADLNNQRLDTTQGDQLFKEIDTALEAGKKAIDAVTSETDLAKAQATGMGKLGAVAAHIIYEETLTDDLKQIATAAKNATDSIPGILEGLNVSSEEKAKLKAEMVKQIEAEVDKANTAIKKAKTDARDNNDQDPTKGMNQATENGVNTLKNLTDSFKKKIGVIQKLVEYADGIKDYFNDAPNLVDKDRTKLRSDVDNAKQAGISDIFAVSDGTSANLEDALTAAKTKVKQATYPTQLLAEKNKQLAAIKAAAQVAKNYIDSKKTTEGNPNGLDQDTINNLKGQIEGILENTINRINNVQIKDNNLAAAISEVQQNESGPKNVPFNYGESGFEAITKLADQTIADINKKMNAIRELSQYRDQKIVSLPNIQNRQDYIDQINHEFESGKSLINAVSIKDDAGNYEDPSDRINGKLSKSKTKMDAIVNQANRQAANNKIISDLQNHKNTAQDIINNSQLSQDQKNEANKAIDEAFNKANEQISDIKNGTVITDDQITDWTNSINAILQKQEYLQAEKDNAVKGFEQEVTGLQTELDNLDDAQKAAYKDDVAKINGAINAINNPAKGKDTIKDATAEYVKGLIALNKLKAKINLDQAAAAAKEKAPNGGKDIDDATNKAKDKIDGLPNDVSPTDKVDKIINDINAAEQAGKS
ncbi:signal peptide-containing protein, YSIRK family, partial [Lactobacillus bombicola]